jgi:hypothetical protein
MAGQFQEFVAAQCALLKQNVEEALMRIPEGKRGWAPAESSRSAMDQAAEVAMLNGASADLIKDRAWPADFDMEAYFAAKEKLAADWPTLKAMLDANTEKLVKTILSLKDDELAVSVETPFGTKTVAELVGYPYWNMSYHEGQINYIASILGCLD